MSDTQATANEVRACTCHPSDNPPQPCPQKYALTHCHAAAIAKALRHACITEINDDMSQRGSVNRARHIERVDAMIAAAEFLEQVY